MSDDDVTVGELFRALGKVEKAVDDGFKKVNERIDKMRTEFVSKDLYESERDAMRQDIKSTRDEVDDTVTSRRWWLTTALAVVAVAGQFVYYIH